MADYRDRLDEWREAARRKARELDEKYNIRERVEGGARAAEQAARRGAEAVKSGAERARAEAERLGEDYELGEHAQDVRERAQEAREHAARAAEEAARVAREVGGRVRDAGQKAGERAADVLGGAAFPGLDAVLLGAHPHWLTHSALPVWAVRRLGKKFDGYLRERERLVAAGELDEAERKRLEFERKMVRYVGAPLLGAFSCAAGVAIWAQILQPGPIVGAPISWLLGGNPVLDGIWLFAKGVVRFHRGYKL